MLSTRLGFERPAFFAEAFAFALLAGVNFVCPLFFGAGFSQGALAEDFLGIVTDTPNEAAQDSSKFLALFSSPPINALAGR